MLCKESPHPGLLLVISAPSGAGKTTLSRKLFQLFPSLRPSISCTTRLPRPNERDSVDYFFVDDAEFDDLVEKGAFVEWANVHGRRYGTKKATIEEACAAGTDILLDIDCQGAAILKRQGLEAIFIFILPPNLAELENRLRKRASDSEESIRLRLHNARQEMASADGYDYIVINDDLDQAVAELCAIITAEHCRTQRRHDALEKARA
ncbi:MAG: guanylate kinase [bacterium]|nr:guanylate kinase [bacterium]